MSTPERPKKSRFEETKLERGFRENDSVHLLQVALDMLTEHPEEPIGNLFGALATQIQSDHDWREFLELGDGSVARSRDAMEESGREAIKLVSIALRKLGAKFELLEGNAPKTERDRVREMAAQELKTLLSAILVSRTDWLDELRAANKES